MNHQCFGDIFTVEGQQYYRCFLDGKIIETFEEVTALAGFDCPNCKRKVEATMQGELPVTMIRTVELPRLGRIKIPPVLCNCADEKRGKCRIHGDRTA